MKHGRFKRSSDSQTIQRYRCNSCKTTFSQASFDPAYYQKKRHLNYKCAFLLSSMISMNRLSLVLNIHPITVARKLEYMAGQARKKCHDALSSFSTISDIQFDELQTIEHTKCKPLSVIMAVSKKERKIIAFQVSKMPATGYLASIARKKYGPRKDERLKGMTHLFEQLQQILTPNIRIQSDECRFYKPVVNTYFPQAHYLQFKGKKSAVSGQGELKKGAHDPLFSINHTFAMCRGNINRLIRKTWCTTKKISRLIDHLYIYMWVHNWKLTAPI